MSFYVTFNVKSDKYKGFLNTQYAKAIRLRGEWEVGIIQCHMPNNYGTYWLFSNLVDFNYVNEIPMQLMDVVDTSESKIRKPLYQRVVRKTISSINIEVRRDPAIEGFVSESDSTDITCILHFRKA